MIDIKNKILYYKSTIFYLKRMTGFSKIYCKLELALEQHFLVLIYYNYFNIATFFFYNLTYYFSMNYNYDINKL